MLDVVLRPPQAVDLVAVRALCQAVLDRDDAPGEIADLLLGNGCTPGRLAVAAYARQRLVGVAAGAMRTRADGQRTGHLDLIAVQPQHQRAGIGRALVTHAERWAAGRGAGALWWGNDAPTYAWPGVERGYRAAHGLATALGYSPERDATNQRVVLTDADLGTDQDERRLAGEGITVERMDPAEAAGLLAWVATFGGTWAAEAAQSLARRPVGCHVARRGSEWVGFACHGGNRSGWFGPMGTAESERGRGIGAVLLRRCLADQRAAGLTSTQIAWVGPVAFYARAVGAVLDRQFTLYRKELAAG